MYGLQEFLKTIAINNCDAVWEAQRLKIFRTQTVKYKNRVFLKFFFLSNIELDLERSIFSILSSPSLHLNIPHHKVGIGKNLQLFVKHLLIASNWNTVMHCT